jgi:hypothetical protein
MTFTLPALVRLEKLASPEPSKGLERFVSALIVILTGAVLIGICTGLVSLTFHAIAGGR